MLANDKRRKNPNMTFMERMLLIELVEEHYQILRNKKNDMPSRMVVNEVWQKIAEEFNARGLGSVRDSVNLRGTWDNFKKLARKSLADAKQPNTHSEDEARKRVKLDPPLERALALIQSSAEGLANTYDGDSQSVSAGDSESVSAVEEVRVLANGSVDGAPVELSFEDADWGECSTSVLKSPIHPGLSPIASNRDADNAATLRDSLAAKPKAVTPITASDEPASTSDEPVAVQIANVPAVKISTKRKRSILQEDCGERLDDLKAEALTKAMEEESKEHLWRGELHKLQLAQEKLKAEILKEQLKQERLKTAKLLSELSE